MCPYIWMPPYFWMAPVCLNAPLCLDGPCMFVCTPYVWTHPLFAWMLPICLDAPMCGHPHMFGHPPVCLDTTHMFGCPQYVWTPPVCLDDIWMPLYIHNTKKACFLTIRSFHMPIHLDAPYIWMALCMFGCPLICLNAPICVYTPACLDAPMFGCYLYVWTPPVCLDAPICMDDPCMFG